MASALRTVLMAAATMTGNVTSANSTQITNLETSTDLLSDRLGLVSATTITGISYGILTSLYCAVTHFLLKRLYRHNARWSSDPQSFSRSRSMRYKTLFYIVYSSALFILATLYTAGNAQNAVVAYVDNRLYPGGPYAYYITYMAAEPTMVITDVSATMILWMTDGLILGRFVVFYYDVAYGKLCILFLCAMFVGVMVLSALLLWAETGLGRIYFLSANFLISYYVLSFSLCVLATMLISARLYWYKVRLRRLFGRRMESPYMSIATVLIESASIYAIWSLAFFVLYVLQSPGQTVILATMPHVQAIAPFLIILWIARGKAWNQGKSLSRGDRVAPDHNPVSSIGRFSFGAPPVSVAGQFGMDGDHPLNEGQNASWSTVGGCRAEHGDDNADVIELGPCDPKPWSVVGDVKA